MNINTINKIEEIYIRNKKDYAPTNIKNLISIMVIRDAIIGINNREYFDQIIYYYYYIILGILNKEE